jgi:hypothetical protein
MQRKGSIESVVEFRGSFIELVIVAVAISLGINIWANLLGAQLTPNWLLTVSVALIAIGCWILIRRVAPRINRQIFLTGFLPIEKKDQRIIVVPRYEFSRQMGTFFRALFHENKALEKIWKASNVASNDLTGKEKEKEKAGKKLVEEAVEYFVLSRLSMALSSHFVNNEDIEVDGAEIVTLERKDIPSVLLDNRFLDLLSRPLEERETFVSTSKQKSKRLDILQGSRIVYAITADGAVYDYFELILPRGSQVTREADALRINTKRFSLSFEIDFSGFRGNFPSEFEELYLGFQDDIDVIPFLIWIRAGVRFKLRYIFSRKGWEYFKWLDNFLNSLEDDFSFESFLKNIDWEAAHTSAIIERNLNIRAKQST